MKKSKKKNSKKNSVSSLFSNNKESNFSLFEVIIIILISIVFGVIIGYLITYGNSSLSRVRTDSGLSEVVYTYNNIVDNYYGEIDKGKLAEAAVKGMISSLDDPYSLFLDETSTDNFNESVDGEYVGIGVMVQFVNEYHRVLSLMEDGPAYQSGLQVDDVILSVDGVDCHNITPSDLTQLISGEVGKTVEILVRRGEEELSIKVPLKTIEVQNVQGRTYDVDSKKVGYIRIDVFSSNSYDQFVDVLKSLEKKKIQGLILDVRDNPGGHLAQVKNVLSLFFDKNTVLYQVESRGRKQKVYSSSNDEKAYPVVVLINHDTASSAEVLAACFQENYKNVHIVGTNSYGKGNVQKSLSLSSGTSIKFTIEEWLTPSGKSVINKGVVPDILIEEESTSEVDPYLEKAFELLK